MTTKCRGAVLNCIDGVLTMWREVGCVYRRAVIAEPYEVKCPAIDYCIYGIEPVIRFREFEA